MFLDALKGLRSNFLGNYKFGNYKLTLGFTWRFRNARFTGSLTPLCHRLRFGAITDREDRLSKLEDRFRVPRCTYLALRWIVNVEGEVDLRSGPSHWGDCYSGWSLRSLESSFLLIIQLGHWYLPGTPFALCQILRKGEYGYLPCVVNVLILFLSIDFERLDLHDLWSEVMKVREVFCERGPLMVGTVFPDNCKQSSSEALPIDRLRGSLSGYGRNIWEFLLSCTTGNFKIVRAPIIAQVPTLKGFLRSGKPYYGTFWDFVFDKTSRRCVEVKWIALVNSRHFSVWLRFISWTGSYFF